MAVCKRVIYAGRVQGVGFRYTARNIAGRYDVTGYVKNLPDGTVELVAQGEPGEVDRFLEAVASQMAGYIHDRTTSSAPEMDHAGFTIRH